MSDPRHQPLLEVVQRLPSDFAPLGERSRENDWGPDCSCGCRWFIPLEHGLRYDWGVCHNPRLSRGRARSLDEHARRQGCAPRACAVRPGRRGSSPLSEGRFASRS